MRRGLVDPSDVLLGVDVASKEELLDYAARHAADIGVTDDMGSLVQDLRDREGQISTGLTDGFAIPHAKSPHVTRTRVLYIRTRKPIAWEMLDDSMPDCFFVLLVPETNEGNVHLRLISSLATCLLEEDFRTGVRSMTDPSGTAEFINASIETDRGEE